MSFSFGAGVRDSLSNLAASLGTGRDKASHDAFMVIELGRAQIEAMYRGDWLARKVVDIVPYDSVRAWRSWSGHRADVARFEAAERRLGLRRTVQRAMTLGRLYGGGAIIIGDGEQDVARLAQPLDPRLPRGGLAFLHAVSRWQLGVTELELNPLSPWCGEPKLYTLSSPGQPLLELHPSRVVRFLGNPLPDPSLAVALWSDSVLQALYDAVHAAALSLAGATSLLHEAKVDVVTVPNLSEHLSSAETTEQLSARFAYAAAMKSMNNLLLLGDGESWSRQTVDFAGLPEMARTFLQVAAGAADIPVTRLLGQSPAGLSATGESDVRNYYDMIAARQELDLRPQLERLDRLICWSEDIDEGALTFAFRPLWQLDEPAKAALALSRAQATQVYAGLKLWPDAAMAKLAEAQLVADGTYPNAAAVFAEEGPDPSAARSILDDNHDPNQPRDVDGRWTAGGSGAGREAEVHPLLSTPETGVAPAGGLAGPPRAGAQTLSTEGPADLAHETPEERLTRILGPPETDLAKIDPAWREHAVKGVVAPALGSPRLLAAAVAFLAYRALQSTLQGAARNLSSWFRTAPPPPSPKGSGPPPSEPHNDPPPLTVHGPRGPSGPPGLAPAGSAPTSPPGREPEASLPPLPPSRSAEPFTERPAGPPPTSADPTQPPGYVFNEKAEDPAPDRSDHHAKPVNSIVVPDHSIVLAKKGTPREQGDDYAEKVRIILDFEKAPRDNALGGKMPDGVLEDPPSGLEMALEVKYLSRTEGGLRDPDRTVKFINGKDIAQARKYNDKCKGGLLWVVNDERLIDKYARMLEEDGIHGVRIICIPSLQE